MLDEKYKLVPITDAEEYAIITTDKELVKYCEAFGINCTQVKKPATRDEFKERARRLVLDIESQK